MQRPRITVMLRITRMVIVPVILHLDPDFPDQIQQISLCNISNIFPATEVERN